MAAKKWITASKYLVMRRQGHYCDKLSTTSTIADAKKKIAADMAHYSGYGYAIYGLVGEVHPIVPELELITTADCPCADAK